LLFLFNWAFGGCGRWSPAPSNMTTRTTAIMPNV
jgi:hypothetical protein